VDAAALGALLGQPATFVGARARNPGVATKYVNLFTQPAQL